MANKGEPRLGKGLGALLGEYLEDVERASASEREVPIGLVRPNPFQPRRQFDEDGLEELADSIRQNGLLQPLVVRPAGSAWEIVAGERRWRALKRAGWERAPVLVRELTDEQMLVLALVENLQREDLSALEEATGYQALLDEFGLTQQEVAERVGKDRSTVANAVRLLALPAPVQELMAAGRITAGHGRAILSLPGEARQIALAREVIERGLSVRETEVRARALRGREGTPREGDGGRPPASASPAADPALRRLERALERALGTQVRVAPRAGTSGEVRIAYHDASDLERLARLLAGEAAAELFDSE